MPLTGRTMRGGRRTGALRLVIAVLCALCSVAGRREARAQTPAFRLVYSDSAQCSTPADFTSVLVKEIGADPFIFTAPDVIEVRVEREGGLSRAPDATGGKVWGKYTFFDAANNSTGDRPPFSAEDCKGVLDYLLFSLNRAIKDRIAGKQNASASPTPGAKGEEPQQKKPAAQSGAAQDAKPPTPAPAARRRFGLRLAVDVGAAVAFAPGPMPGGGVSAGGSLRLSPGRALSASLEARTYYPIRQSIESGGDLTVQPTLGLLVPCLHESFLILCVPVGGGAVVFNGYGLQAGGRSASALGPKTAPLAVLGGRIGVEIPVRAPFLVRIVAEAMVPLPPQNPSIDETPETVVWEMPPLNGALLVGAVADFFDGSRRELPMPRSVDFDAVYKEHFGRACRCLRRLGVPERAVEDVAQEVFVVLHRRLPAYDPSRPLRPWLYGIVWNCAVDYRSRAHHRREQLEQEARWEQEGSQPSPEEKAMASEEERRLDAALTELPGKLRDIVILHDLLGFSTGEAARIMHLTEDQVSGRLRQGLAKLKAVLIALGDVTKPLGEVVAGPLQRRRAFLRSVARLPCPMRDVVVMIDIEGMDRAEVARTLQLTASDVEVNLQRARMELAGRVGAPGEGRDALASGTVTEKQRLLMRALEELPLEQRDTFVLLEIEGLSASDVALVLGCAVEDAMANLAKARSALVLIVQRLTGPGGDP